MANLKKLKNRTAQQLCRKEILRLEEKDVFIIFKKKVYPELNPEPERQLKETIRKAIFTDRYEPEIETIALIAIAHHTDLLKLNFSSKKLKQNKRKIEELIEGESVGEAVNEVVQSIKTAMFVVSASTAATTVTS